MNTQYDRSRSRSKTQPKRSHTTHKQTTTKKKKNKTHFFNEFTYSLLIHLINYRATGDARVDETSTSTTKNVARVSINEIVSDNDVRRTQRYNFCICISGVEIGWDRRCKMRRNKLLLRQYDDEPTNARTRECATKKYGILIYWLLTFNWNTFFIRHTDNRASPYSSANQQPRSSGSTNPSAIVVYDLNEINLLTSIWTFRWNILEFFFPFFGSNLWHSLESFSWRLA